MPYWGGLSQQVCVSVCVCQRKRNVVIHKSGDMLQNMETMVYAFTPTHTWICIFLQDCKMFRAEAKQQQSKFKIHLKCFLFGFLLFCWSSRHDVTQKVILFKRACLRWRRNVFTRHLAVINPSSVLPHAHGQMFISVIQQNHRTHLVLTKILCSHKIIYIEKIDVWFPNKPPTWSQLAWLNMLSLLRKLKLEINIRGKVLFLCNLTYCLRVNYKLLQIFAIINFPNYDKL